uniref:2'-phosphotransferase n=1 Tax=Steinernema glaseri TaxID=37863 RepID=A0A1I7ZUW7_9BILA
MLVVTTFAFSLNLTDEDLQTSSPNKATQGYTKRTQDCTRLHHDIGFPRNSLWAPPTHEDRSMEASTTRQSKFLSLVLRHKPEAAGISLDANGWTDVSTLLEALRKKNRPMTRAELDHLVASSEKQRFAFSEDGTRIRANQGHSLRVDLELKPLRPPGLLFHGTVPRFVESIRRDGLQRMRRHHVHLSEDRATAKNVGSRRGSPVILVVRSQEMFDEGFTFFRSENNVWLTDNPRDVRRGIHLLPLRKQCVAH